MPDMATVSIGLFFFARNQRCHDSHSTFPTNSCKKQ